MRPHILITADPVNGRLSVPKLRVAIQAGRARSLWERLKSAADQDLDTEPFLPTTGAPWRNPGQAQHANRDGSVATSRAV